MGKARFLWIFDFFTERVYHRDWFLFCHPKPEGFVHMPDRDRLAQAEKDFLASIVSPWERRGLAICVAGLAVAYGANQIWPQHWSAIAIPAVLGILGLVFCYVWGRRETTD